MTRFRALALFLLIGELAARLVSPAPQPWLWPQTRFEPHPTLGFRLRPNQDSFTADQPFRTNSLGLRGSDVAIAKTRGVRRILVLGDSIASGFGVAERDIFAARLSWALHCEVINAGVPSYDTAQEITYLAEQGLNLQPDVVVLSLYWNDIHDKSGIEVDTEGRLIERHHRPGGPLESATAYSLRNLFKRSRLAYLTTDRLRALAMSFRPPIQRETQLAILHGLDHPRVQQGWLAIDEQFARLAALAQTVRFRPLVMILPMPQQLGGRFPRVRYQSIVRDLCRRHHLPWLDLEPAFERAHAQGARLFLPYDGDHPNSAGHALIAGQLQKALADAD